MSCEPQARKRLATGGLRTVRVALMSMRFRLSTLLGLTVVAGCNPGARHPESVHFPAGWRFSMVDSPLVGRRAMVAMENSLGSQVGADVMRRGGNAIDAVVAVAFAQAVVTPRAGNIGGGGFLLYRQADGQVFGLDFREKAPAAATRNMYLDSAGSVTEKSLIGALAAGVPGSVAGLFEAHRRFGHLPWRDVVAPAIALAKDGHVVDSIRAERVAQSALRLRRFATSRDLFLPGGLPIPRGMMWRQPDLAATLQLIADSGADGFYKGRTADLIVRQMQVSGGIITHADLESYRPLWREPVRISYRGWTIFSMPPSSSGGVTMAEMFNMVESRRLPAFGSAELDHLEVEAMRRAFTDRNRFLGDPELVAMPLDRLLSKRYAMDLRRQIRSDRATPSRDMPPVVEGSETTHYSVVDSAGNAAALTTTLNDNFGNALVIGGAGFLLNDEMDDFAAKPGSPNDYGLVQGEANAIAPNKRMLSAMTPTIVLDPRGDLSLVLGAPGGPRIITAIWQVISNVIDHDMTLAQAVYAPRIHHQALPDSIRWEEGGMDPGVRRRLEAMGHAFAAQPLSIADVEAVRVTPRGLEGVTDPRIQAKAAAGY
jgi:gamma-glutamyltranspeptidase/glutathione hydrolase